MPIGNAMLFCFVHDAFSSALSFAVLNDDHDERCERKHQSRRHKEQDKVSVY